MPELTEMSSGAEATKREQQMVERGCCTNCWHGDASVFLHIQHDHTREIRVMNLCSECHNNGWQLGDWDLMGSK